VLQQVEVEAEAEEARGIGVRGKRKE